MKLDKLVICFLLLLLSILLSLFLRVKEMVNARKQKEIAVLVPVSSSLRPIDLAITSCYRILRLKGQQFSSKALFTPRWRKVLATSKTEHKKVFQPLTWHHRVPLPLSASPSALLMQAFCHGIWLIQQISATEQSF